MRRALPAAVLVCACVLTATARQSRPTPPLEWPADLVRLDVIVSDEKGRPVTGLTVRDFEVVSDQQPVTIARFLTGGEPLSVALLVDITASLHENPDGVAGIPSTAARLPMTLSTATSPGLIPPAVAPFPLKGLAAVDRVRLGAITRQPVLGPPLNGNSKDVEKQWRALFELPPVEWLGPSPIFDAVSDAVTWAASEPGVRAVVLMSDGEASGNHKGHLEVAADAALAGVSVSTIAEEAVMLHGVLTQLQAVGVDPAKPLRTLADATGGWHIFNAVGNYRSILGNGSGVEGGQRPGAFQAVLTLLHHVYSLGFAPVVDGKLHTLDVRVSKPGVTVRARKGYVRAGASGGD